MSRHWSPIRSSFTRGLAAFFATVAVLRMGPATAAPGDIFSQPAPIIGADPPKAADVKDGDVSIGTQTGAMNYSYLIAVPPGRNGMVPQLALSYSSQAAIYGTVAAGWSISGIHLISEDTSRGRLRTHSPQHESVEADPKADDRFVSSNDCHVSAISWGKNDAASLQDFARVAFEWSEIRQCGGIPVGAQLDYRTGTRILNGANLLRAIRSTAFEPGAPETPVHTRLISLSYDEKVDDCTLSHAPVRLLTAIQEQAWGIDSPLVSLPPVTFEYGRPEVNLSAYLPQAWPWQDPNLAWGYRKGKGDWPTIESMLVDLDGDGLQDRLLNAADPINGTC